MIPTSIVAKDPLDDRIASLARAVPLAARCSEIDESPRFPRDEFRIMGRMGLLGLTVDRQNGGSGLSCVRAGRLLYRLGRAGGTMFAKLSLQPEFCYLLGAAGNTRLVAKYYRPLVRGQMLIGNHITEPDAGSDVRAIELEARRVGPHYRISGTKSQVAFAVDADAAIVYGRVAGAPRGEATAFLVPQNLPGIRRRVEPDHGEHWMRRGTVEYNDVELPASHRLGPAGGAWRLLRRELIHERALLGAIYLGVARASWEEAIDYARRREAFGRPISEHQAVGFPLVEDWVRLDAAWRQVEAVLTGIDEGREMDAEAALSKWYASEVSLRAAQNSMHIHGGLGYSRALPLERRLRDLASSRTAHGTSEMSHLIAARSLWPRSTSSVQAGRGRRRAR